MPDKPTATQTRNHETLENFVTYKLNILSNKLTRQGERYLKKHYGIAIPDYRVLLALAYYGEMSVREIASYIEMDKALVSRVVARLVANERVVSKPDPNDGRLVLLSITPTGLALFEEILPFSLDRQRRLLESLDADEREPFMRMLDKLLAYAKDEDDKDRLGAG